MSDPVADLLTFIDASPTPYHAVAEVARRLEAAGFRRIDESERWGLAAGERRYVVRNDASIAAFEVGTVPPAEAGFRIVGSHTDSPNFRVKPKADVTAHGYRQLAVEPYGGVLLYTWLDRDLSIAGRVSVGEGAGVVTRLVSFGRPLVRIPSLAIHLNREIRTAGLQLNEQTHLAPIVGLESASSLGELLAEELREKGTADVDADEILAWDLMLCDTQPADTTGPDDELIAAPRLDNLASCHAGTVALLEAGARGRSAATRVIVLYDHEEVGSRSAHGAGSTFLEDTLARVAASVSDDGDAQSLPRAIARSVLVSADMAHGVHPNWADRHEPGHRPVLGRGPVIKTNAGQSYASDAWSAGFFGSLCARVGFEPQHFVTRSDLPCGSTIGPISAARVGIRTVDVGNPMLAMHSCRETAASADVKPMIDVLAAFFEAAG
jgi:aspartyl aminopeptidase